MVKLNTALKKLYFIIVLSSFILNALRTDISKMAKKKLLMEKKLIHTGLELQEDD